MQPYTESPNNITANIDIASPEEIISQLKKCDMEMFKPNLPHVQTLFDEQIINSIVEVSELIRSLVHPIDKEKRNNQVVMSGCGTSGRIAFLIARTFNNIWKTDNETLTYTIAGGDRALFTSQEAPEDDWLTGVNDLKKVTIGKDRVIFIGITCGLSAPYVAGQLDYCMKNLNQFTPVLLGFNPTALARNVPIDGWDKTFYNVVQNFEESVKTKTAFLINPVLGGEAITGSSRMKGGSITKVILESIFLLASSSNHITQSECTNVLQTYQTTCSDFYHSSSSILTHLLKLGGDSLNNGGRVCYVSSDVSAVLAIIDATECPPTYGASVIDVRGFIVGGYKEYKNKDGDLGHLGEQYCIGDRDFLRWLNDDQGKSRDRNDTIIFVFTEKNERLLQLLDVENEAGKQLKLYSQNNPNSSINVVEFLKPLQKPEISKQDFVSNYYHISVAPGSSTNDVERNRNFIESILEKNLISCCAKWMFNAVSTGAHILKGKVFRNYMVDLKVSNQKLFHRSIGIIQRFCPKLEGNEAKDYLLRSIYEVDELNEEILSSPISSHLKIATPKDKVVPSAIIMATRKCTFKSCQHSLEQCTVIRDALARLETK